MSNTPATDPNTPDPPADPPAKPARAPRLPSYAEQPPADPAKPPTPEKLRRVKRDLEMMDLRAAGWSYFELAQHFGITRQAAHAAVCAALNYTREKLGEKIEQVRTMELYRLDQLQGPIYAKALTGDLQAADRVLDIMARRAKYTGADLPTKVAPTDPTGTKPYDEPISDAERAERIAAVLDRARERRDRQVAAPDFPAAIEAGDEPL